MAIRGSSLRQDIQNALSSLNSSDLVDETGGTAETSGWALASVPTSAISAAAPVINNNLATIVDQLNFLRDDLQSIKTEVDSGSKG